MSPGNDFSNKILDFLETKLLVRIFTATKTQGHFDLHFFAKEIDGMRQLCREIVRIDARAKLNFLHAIGVLMLLALFFLFSLFVTELSEVYETTDWRLSVGGNFDQVHSALSRHIDGIRKRHDAELGALVANDPHLSGTDFPVNPNE